MPYEPSPYFETPCRTKTIWRYMTMDKFMYMLSEKALYFPNISLFSDRKEGKLSDETLQQVWIKHLLDVNNTPIKQDEEFKKYKDFTLGDHYEINVKDIESYPHTRATFDALISEFSNHLMFCNSWFKRDSESHSMWAEYGDKSPTSIAIQTTVDDLIKSIECDSHEIHIGKVKYKDYHTDHIEGYENFTSEDLTDHDNVLKLFYAPVMHKRDIYEDEHEVRAIISFEYVCNYHLGKVYTSDIPFYSDNLFKTDISFFDYSKTNLMRGIPPGIPIRTNIKKLIKTIVVSPYANDYFHKTLRDQMKNNALDPDIVYASDI